LLVAGFGYPPNEAAATRLVERVLPLVRDPRARVVLVGRDLSPELQRRWSGRPVNWLGVVDDLTPLYARAAAVVLPYDRSTNTGTPLKVAEAIANGIPVIATPNATEALGLVAGTHVLAAATDRELAAAITRLLNDEDLARELARQAHVWARENLAPDRLAERLKRDSRLAAASG
jgi:glycosyltransferase involved in cell wall biosynthesis